MHGRGDGCGDRRPFVRHMWPATRVEAAPPSAKGPSLSSRSPLLCSSPTDGLLSARTDDSPASSRPKAGGPPVSPPRFSRLLSKGRTRIQSRRLCTFSGC
ncbi:hypothetical protein ACQ4PT_044160 [Festuca glaucescens]